MGHRMACILARNECLFGIGHYLGDTVADFGAGDIWIGQNDDPLTFPQGGNFTQTTFFQAHAAGGQNGGVDGTAHSADIVLAFDDNDLFNVFLHACLT